MLKEYRLYALMTLVGAGCLAVVFSFPALTTPEGPLGTGRSADEIEAVLAQERAFCEAQPQSIDCRCFVDVAGTVLLHNEPRVPGATYADKQDLARGQATDDC
ncbi:MAG: hypothetical protein AAFP16_13370 [Pseudomonadota bacterium]